MRIILIQASRDKPESIVQVQSQVQSTEITILRPSFVFQCHSQDAKESDILESIRLNYPFLSLLPNELINRQLLLQGHDP